MRAILSNSIFDPRRCWRGSRRGSARGEEKSDPFCRVSVMIAPVVGLLEIRWFVHLVVERGRFRQRTVGRSIDLVKLAADAIRAHQVHGVRFVRLVVAIAADHVDVQLRHDLVHRHGRVVGEISRAEQAALLAGMPDEEQRSARPLALGKCAGQRHQCHRAGSIVVGTVPDAIVAAPRGDAPGRPSTALAVGIADGQCAPNATNVSFSCGSAPRRCRRRCE